MNISDPPPSRANVRTKVLLLENIHKSAVEAFERRGFEVEHRREALKEGDLVRALAGVQLLGIRSKTRMTERVLAEAKDLLSVGCFCIGTNQVELPAAKMRGVPVF